MNIYLISREEDQPVCVVYTQRGHTTGCEKAQTNLKTNGFLFSSSNLQIYTSPTNIYRRIFPDEQRISIFASVSGRREIRYRNRFPPSFFFTRLLFAILFSTFLFLTLSTQKCVYTLLLYQFFNHFAKKPSHAFCFYKEMFISFTFFLTYI